MEDTVAVSAENNEIRLPFVTAVLVGTVMDVKEHVVSRVADTTTIVRSL
jgi:hypothetical protein